MKNFVAASSRFLPPASSSFEVRSTMLIRCVSTASARLQSSKMQLGRILNKVMQMDRTKRNRNGHEPVNSALLADSGTRKATAVHRCAAAPSRRGRRVTILNKVFMKHITDLMATGEVASNLVGKGIEISHVEVAPDFSRVDVYWFAQGNADSYEKILRVSAGHLQHELSQLRVIGLVPPIHFVKNRHYGKLKEVEDRLATVDFGPDYVPTGGHVAPLPGAPILEVSLSAQLRSRIFSVDGQGEDRGRTNCEIPEMRQDVMGFDHATVMKKIKNSVKKSQGVAASNGEQGQPANGDAAAAASPPRPLDQQVGEFLSSKEQAKLFSDFLKKRAIEEKRKQRLVPLLEVKMQEERDWVERMRDEDDEGDEEDVSIDEPYRDEYESKKHN